MTAMLVIDVGTTGLRAAIVDDSLAVRAMEYRPCPPSTPAPGLVEFDGADLAAKLLEAARTALAAATEPVVAVGITNQRASTLVWDRATGEPVAPGLGWQDLRTVGECIMAKAEHGWSVAPNQSSTKAGWLLANTRRPGRPRSVRRHDRQLDRLDAERRRAPRQRPDECVGHDERIACSSTARCGHTTGATRSACPNRRCPASSTPSASSATQLRSPGPRRSPRCSATSRPR